MENEAAQFIRIAFGAVFLLTLAAGGYLLKNYQQLFGVDPQLPSETESSRAYSRVQIFLVWIHAVFLTGSLALLLH
ncbi:MAG TPA: hypothetical protein VF593_07595 [Chthoniobacteraceae bacterium]|jgi:hypothetical protein